jgi:hypothetical protein
VTACGRQIPRRLVRPVKMNYEIRGNAARHILATPHSEYGRGFGLDQLFITGRVLLGCFKDGSYVVCPSTECLESQLVSASKRAIHAPSARPERSARSRRQW